MLAALGTLTQTAPAPAATAMSSEQHGTGPIRTVATTWFVAGSILETLGPPLFTTQTAPGVVAIPSGCGPTGIVAASELSCGSIRRTLSSYTRAIQSAPLPAAASPQLPGKSVQAFFDAMGVRATTVFVAGSIRIKIGTASLVAQTAPSPTARAPEFGGIGILATTVPTLGRAARRAAEPCASTTPAMATANATSAVMRTRLVVFMLPPSSRGCVSRSDRSTRRNSCLRGSPWDRRRSRENPEPAEGESARRPDPQHAAVVVVDPDRAETDAEADGRPADMEPRGQPTGARVDPVDVGRVDDGGPDGAECEREPDRMRLDPPSL